MSSDEEAPVIVFDERSYGIINRKKPGDLNQKPNRSIVKKGLIDLDTTSVVTSDKRLTMDAEEYNARHDPAHDLSFILASPTWRHLHYGNGFSVR